MLINLIKSLPALIFLILSKDLAFLMTVFIIYKYNLLQVHNLLLILPYQYLIKDHLVLQVPT